jgi:hypothetical protein
MESLKRVRKRKGRCFELALKAMMDEPAEADLRLVHGTVRMVTGERMTHAWLLLPDGRIYDVVLDRYFESERAFVDFGEAIVDRIYTVLEAAKAVIDSGHSGPWPTPPATTEDGHAQTDA